MSGHKNLRSFIEQLRKEQDIVEIKAEVDPYLELAEIHRRVVDEEGPALLFTNVKGSKFPVVTNLFGTRRRVEMSIGPKPNEIINKAIRALDELMPPRFKPSGVNGTGCLARPKPACVRSRYVKPRF